MEQAVLVLEVDQAEVGDIAAAAERGDRVRR